MAARVALAAALGLFAAGCGGGSKSPSVASLDATTRSTTSDAKPSQKPSMTAFAACMSAHGVLTESPGGHGAIISAAPSAQVSAAMAACRARMPPGGPPPLTPALQAKRTQQLYVFAKCMRARALPAHRPPDQALARTMSGARVTVVLAVVGVALLAGCGGGSKAPSVANLPPSQHSATTTASTPAVVPAAPSGPGHGLSAAIKVPDGVKFSACMRKNGVPNFPDPNAQGVIQLGAADGIDLGSPKFRTAQQACRKVLPNGGQPSPQQVAKAQQAALAFSACMRKHGIKDFPDPTFTGGGVSLRLRGGPGSDLDPQLPLFQKARAACQALIPGKFGK